MILKKYYSQYNQILKAKVWIKTRLKYYYWARIYVDNIDMEINWVKYENRLSNTYLYLNVSLHRLLTGSGVLYMKRENKSKEPIFCRITSLLSLQTDIAIIMIILKQSYVSIFKNERFISTSVVKRGPNPRFSPSLPRNLGTGLGRGEAIRNFWG